MDNGISMLTKKKLCNVSISNKIVFIRCDMNVPLNSDGSILSDKRIISSLPTIIYALEQGSRIVLLSHLGRVKQESDKKRFSLKVVADYLRSKLQKILEKDISVHFLPQTSGPKVKQAVQALKSSEILMLENTRFEDLNNKAESKNNTDLAKEWAGLADIFINDAFGTVHRAHASNVGIAEFVNESCLGFLVEYEIKQLSALINNPKKPFVAIMGGAKISDKLGVLVKLLKIVDKLLVGGGIAYTFLKAMGHEIGRSLYDKNSLEGAAKLYEEYKDKIVLPIDFVCASSATSSSFEILESIPPHLDSLDVGPKTIALFEQHISKAQTIFWNGPLGFYERPEFAVATKNIAQILANHSHAYIVIGGGDSAAAVGEFASKISHISTGGGASLEYLEGKLLPGLSTISECFGEECSRDCMQEWYNLRKRFLSK